MVSQVCPIATQQPIRRKEISIPISIAYGSNDAHVPSEFMNYLQRVRKDSGGQSHTFMLVEGCGHNVSREDKNWQSYINLVLS
jgi:pimeloyl-ACP methyl ester carboxylesterase